MKVAVEAAGKTGRCKNCRQNVIVPQPEKPIEPIAEPVQQARVPQRLNPYWPTCIILIGLMTWGFCASNDIAPTDYRAIIGSGVGVFWLLAIRLPWKRAAVGAVVICYAWAFVYGYHNTTVEHWNKENIEYTDRYTQWEHVLIHRRVTFFSDDGDRETTIEGDFAGTGKQHGHWTTYEWSSRESEDQFYWYGEPISEGEWHLRSNQH